MDHKSFKEQLVEVAISLGFKSKSENKARPRNKINNRYKTRERIKDKRLEPFISLSQRNQLKVIKEWAVIGRRGKRNEGSCLYEYDITTFIDCLYSAEERKDISAIDMFFCLVGFKIGSRLNCHRSYYFKNHLFQAAIRAKVDNLKDEDRITFDQAFEQVKDIIDQKEFNEELIKCKEEIKKEEESKKREQARNFLKSFTNLVDKAMQTEIKRNARLITDRLSDRDLNLALEWSNDIEEIKNELKFSKLNISTMIEKYGKNWELGRVLSARAAEKAAKTFYERYGKKVEDVSIKQIDKYQRDSRWKDFDLMVNGCLPIDVKNARRGKESPDRYVEHYVPKFKHNNRYNQNVVIAGILSHYLWPSSLLTPEEANKDTTILFLGETTIEKQKNIKKEFEDDKSLLIDFGKPDRDAKFFLPPWIFDYPDYVYRERNKALEEFRKKTIPYVTFWQKAQLNPIPVCIAAGIDLKRFWDEESLSEWEWDLFYEFLNRKESDRLSLPFVYLTLLKHFLCVISNPSFAKNFSPYKYRKIVFFDYNNYNHTPLCIYDPLKTIDSLIESLNTLWKAEHELVSSFRIFRLVRFNILLGKSSKSDSWKTLIAYCGGFTDNGRCAKNPLVLGDQRHCPICGKLICSVCDFCNINCKRYMDFTENKQNSIF